MKIKKLISMLTAFACSVVLTVPLSAMAYDPCDVDHDGQVNILDVITINRHLAGTYFISNYNQLDANQNLIVDSADAQCVMNKIVGNSYSAKFYSREASGTGEIDFPSISGTTTLDDAASSTASRQYVKYTYGSMPSSYTGNYLNSYLTTYSLTPAFDTLTTSNNTRGQIFGGDSIVPATNSPENTGIVRINHAVEYFDDDDNPRIVNSMSTGFIVGNHTIATAAHCVYTGYKTGIYNNTTHIYEHTKERFYTPTITTYNSDGSASTTTLTPVEVHISANYRAGHTSQYDYALITVEEDLSNYVHFSLGNSYNVTGTNFNHVPIYVTGAQYVNSHHLLYTDEGNVYTSSNGTVFKYVTSTAGGESGSPVYTITKQTFNGTDSYVYTALAVHSGAGTYAGNSTYYYNQGPRITNYLIKFYLGNPNISY